MWNRLIAPSILTLVFSCIVSCTGEPIASEASQPATESGAATHHGAIVCLGQVELGDEKFALARHGACTEGKESAFVLTAVGAPTEAVITLWLEDADGAQVSAGAKGEASGNDLHFHTMAKSAASRVVMQREGLTTTETASIHSAVEGTRDGIAAPLLDAKGAVSGWVELKLHDDKGDLELWLDQTGGMQNPLDIPITETAQVSFLGSEKRSVTLAVRNAVGNEDEDGKANNRKGLTNYFIFPGDTGTDASWLMGASFRSIVTIQVNRDGKPLKTQPFLLVPHTHGPSGHQH